MRFGTEQSPHVLDDDQPRAQAGDCVGHVFPQAGTGAGPQPEALPGVGQVLAGESPGEHVHWFDLVPVHGGYVAAIFDQFMGMAQIIGKQPGMTGTLNVRYLRPTPLNTELQLAAWLERLEGRKTIIKAEMRNGATVTASCEALFIRPKGGLGLRDMDHSSPD